MKPALFLDRDGTLIKDLGKGLVTMQEMESVNSYFLDQLQQQQINISKVFICPHKKEDLCDCRKPKPYFIDQAFNEFEIDLSQSYVIGDHPSDIELGINRNVKGIYLLTGHGRKHFHELTNFPTSSFTVYKSLHYFVKSIQHIDHK